MLRVIYHSHQPYSILNIPVWLHYVAPASVQLYVKQIIWSTQIGDTAGKYFIGSYYSSKAWVSWYTSYLEVVSPSTLARRLYPAINAVKVL